MTSRAARLLISLYPRSWRARYAEEFEDFLIQDAGFRDIADVLCCALREHIILPGDLRMTNLQRSLVWMAYSCLAAILAGINLWWTVDDTPLARAMQDHALLSASWAAVEAGSLMMLIAALAAGLPALFAIVRFARVHHRRDVLVRLAFPPSLAMLLLIWAVVMGRRVHWLPTPWDVTGDWTAPSSWPPLSLRWELSAITTTLLVATVLGTAISVKGAIERCPLRIPRFTRFAALALAASMALMLGGALAWGLLSERYDPATFHSRAGGFFGIPLILSWTGSGGLFLAAALTGLWAARLSLRPAAAPRP